VEGPENVVVQEEESGRRGMTILIIIMCPRDGLCVREREREVTVAELGYSKGVGQVG
jgi:hypothetical protein